jgi:glycosyltransferase involved in cell wall biosynthesis
MPTVSIVLPLYNYGKYLDDCVKSILAQTFTDFEVIIVDDCSTDDSYAKAEPWTKKDERVKLVQQPENKMLAAAKNRGILESSGEYIVHLDADDMLTPDSLAVRLAEFESNPGTLLVHARAYKFNGDQSYEWCMKKKDKLEVDYKTKIHAQGVMLKRECFDKYGLYDENLRTNSDKEMWLRLRDLVKIPIVASLVPVAFYRRHPNTMMMGRAKDKAWDNHVQGLLKKAVKMRQEEGITKENTRFP